MKTKMNIAKYFIELTVVFIGITGAFLLNSWREDHKDAQLEKKYLLSFRQEIEDNGKELGRVIELNSTKNERVKRYVEMITNKSVPPDSAVSMLSEMMSNYPLMPKMDTYTSITGSGNLNLISDFNLRKSLITYYHGFEHVKLQEDVYIDYIINFIFPFINNHLDLASQTLDSAETIQTLAFRNLIMGYAVLLQQNLKLYQGMAKMNNRLNSELDSI